MKQTVSERFIECWTKKYVNIFIHAHSFENNAVPRECRSERIEKASSIPA